MSDGPLPKSTCGVDSSPEAAMVTRLQKYVAAYEKTANGNSRACADYRAAAALLAQVARERDEAFKREEGLRVSLDSSQRELRAAKRRLAEARAALDDLSRAVSRDLRAEGEWQAADARKRLSEAQSKARALLSGETT